MNVSQLKEHLPVYAEGPSGLAGASNTHIGNIDSVEGNKYVKLIKNNATDGQHHWFPVDWVRAIYERAVYLEKTVDEVAAELMNEQPSGM